MGYKGYTYSICEKIYMYVIQFLVINFHASQPKSASIFVHYTPNFILKPDYPNSSSFASKSFILLALFFNTDCVQHLLLM